jgi:ketosteroid isomerase-like protein
MGVEDPRTGEDPRMDDPKVSSRLTIAQTFLNHVGHEDTQQAITLLSPAITYKIPGNHRLSGVFTGKTEVSRHLAALVEVTRGTFDLIQWEDWMQGTQHISVLANVQMQREGRIMDGHVVVLLRFDREDRIDEIEVIAYDQSKVDRFFA